MVEKKSKANNTSKSAKKSVASTSQKKQQTSRNNEVKNAIKKPLLVGIIAIVVLVLVGAGVFAYNLWYQNPDKVFVDAVQRGLTQENVYGQGKVSVAAKDTNATIDFTSQSTKDAMSFSATATVKTDDGEITLPADVIYNKENDGEFYIKVKNVDKLVDQFIEISLSAQPNTIPASQKALYVGLIKTQLNPIVKKVDNQWIKITQEDIDKNSKNSTESATCVTKAVESFVGDKKQQKEQRKLYRDNAFFVADKKLGSKDGKIGFSYTFDDKKAEQYGEKFKESEFAKKIESCDKSSQSTKSTKKSSKAGKYNITMELWVNRWSHRLEDTVVTIDGPDQDITVEYSADYKKDVSVDIPSDVVPLKDVQKEFERLAQ